MTNVTYSSDEGFLTLVEDEIKSGYPNNVSSGVDILDAVLNPYTTEGSLLNGKSRVLYRIKSVTRPEQPSIPNTQFKAVFEVPGAILKHF